MTYFLHFFLTIPGELLNAKMISIMMMRMIMMVVMLMIMSLVIIPENITLTIAELHQYKYV